MQLFTRMTTVLLVALAFAAFGVLFISIGIGMSRNLNRFRGRASRAAATVTDVRARSAGTSGGLVWVPVVRFTTPGGRTVEAETGSGTNLERHQPGQPLEVLYDPDNPTDVRVPGGGTTFIPVAFIAMGGIFALIGLLVAAIAIAVA